MTESAFFLVLSTASAVTSLASSRIYPGVLPLDPTLPAIVYSFVGGSVTPTHDTRGIMRSRVEISCFGHTYGDAVNLRDAVIQTLAGYSDQHFSSQILQTIDFFDHEALQFRAVVEVYVWSPL